MWMPPNAPLNENATSAYQSMLLNNHKAMLLEAYCEAVKSPDPSTQNGVILTDPGGGRVFKGHNAPTHGMRMTDEDWQPSRKYLLVEHAERAGIYNAAAMYGYTSGLTMYAVWAACADCARAIVQAGIVKLIRHSPAHRAVPERWKGSVLVGDQILRAGGVIVVNVELPIPEAPPILFDGKLWNPGGETCST